jgi:hypothetical protein
MTIPPSATEVLGKECPPPRTTTGITHRRLPGWRVCFRPEPGPVLASLDSGCGRCPNDNQRKQALKEHRTRSAQVKSLRFEGLPDHFTA